ncbi:hypothetical protein [Phocaeicola sp.]
MKVRELDEMYVFTNEIRRHSDITIIYPEEKIKADVGKGSLKELIRDTVLFYAKMFEKEQLKWNGISMECRVKQMKQLVKHHFYFGDSAETEKRLDKCIEEILYITH